MAKIAGSILIVIFWISSTEGASFITPYEMTWDNATSNCTIETPTILFVGSRMGLPVNYNSTGNDGVWVGYYLVATAFQYIGCVKVENITSSAVFDHNTPGFCYSACNKTKFIGVNEKKCFCFNDTIPQNKFGTSCAKGCRDQEYIACGGNDSISVYTIDAPKIYNGTGDCLLYQKDKESDPILSWSYCNQTNQIICTYNYSRVHQMRVYNDIRRGIWRNAMNMCFNNKRLPTSVSELDQLNERYFVERSWTGVIRSDVIYSFKELATDTVPRKFGFLIRRTSSSKTLLKFTTKAKIKKHALCKNAIETTTLSSSENSASATTSGLGDSASIFQQNVTVANLTISPTNNSTMKRAKKIKFSDFVIPIGVSISIFLIIAGAVIAVKLTKRRGKMPVVFCNISPSDTTQNRTNDTSLIINNLFEGPSDSPYEQIDKVEPRTSKAAVNDVQLDNENYVQVNLDLENNATKSINDMAQVNQDKGVYNTLNFYGGSFDDTYDTLEKATN